MKKVKLKWDAKYVRIIKFWMVTAVKESSYKHIYNMVFFKKKNLDSMSEALLIKDIYNMVLLVFLSTKMKPCNKGIKLSRHKNTNLS